MSHADQVTRFVLHRADNGAFRVFEVDQCAYCGDLELGHDDLSAVPFNGRDRVIDRVHADGALQSEHWFSFYNLRGAPAAHREVRDLHHCRFGSNRSQAAPKA